MRKAALTVLCVITLSFGARAQKFTQGYIDSAKEFLTQWAHNNNNKPKNMHFPFVDPVIMDNTTAQSMFDYQVKKFKAACKREKNKFRIGEYSKDYNATIVDSATVSTRYSGFWMFSLPVFIKNGEFCVFFHMFFNGGGYDEVTIYRNDHGHWILFETVLSGKIGRNFPGFCCYSDPVGPDVPKGIRNCK